MGQSKRRAIIIGGSLAGLFAGNLLRNQGWDARIFERVPDPLAGRGAGIATHQELLDVLQLAGTPMEATVGVPITGRVVFDRAGEVVGELPYPQVMTSWGRIYELLAQRFPAECYVQGRNLIRVEQNASQVTAHFDKGEQHSADLLVGADGIRSTVREQFCPDLKPSYVGYVAWRGLVDEWRFSQDTQRALFGRLGFCLPQGEQLIGYPVAGEGNSTTPGKRRYNLVWYRPADEHTTLRAMLTDDNGRMHANGIPPPLIRKAVTDQLRADARQLLSPQFAEAFEHTPQPFFQPIYDLESPRLAFGRVALIGDAAYVARPHLGMGVTKAASDAAVLAGALARHGADLNAALAEYEKARMRVGAAMIARARHLGAYMQAQQRTPQERAMAERYRTPEAVMRETAVAFSID